MEHNDKNGAEFQDEHIPEELEGLVNSDNEIGEC